MDDLARRIDAALPQTQCQRCSYADCAAYAQAIAAGQASIRQCPPGGQEGIARLAAITGLPEGPLDPEFGIEGPVTVAIIDEDWCIGCTLCIKACPTDAIVGIHKRMHTVVEPHCTGCELCIPVCPVDCISLEPVSGGSTGWQAWTPEQAQAAKDRYEARKARLAREKAAQDTKQTVQLEAKLADMPAHSTITDPAELERKRAVVEAALARARARRQGG